MASMTIRVGYCSNGILPLILHSRAHRV